MQRTSKMTCSKRRSGSRAVHRLMDEVYREMYQLESGRPGAEMGLALALLRAHVSAGRSSRKGMDWDWLKTVSPICLKMIEESLDCGSAVASALSGSFTAASRP